MTETATATFGGGCFWCVEAAFEQLAGVRDVTSGYAGGHTDDPTYREVCDGSTGHAEVVQVEYDTDELAYEDLLEVFFKVHDPTTLNRQGPDVGEQYRSIILYHDDEQRDLAEAFVDDLDAAYDDPVVTEIEELEAFYRAEDKHQNYFEKHPNQAYCSVNVAPKVAKVREEFAAKVE
ncbi:peptide-methionine (S)-S-oxide reductase MsrA [Halobacterium sp. CBA1126]|uniref:peptide-methionine (S)-S-oxide reductase MsrA n=1 Tax=Halobacterium TaxID=2239 RepID=UPI0012FA4E1B|nr:peptide-methionine (S)-S-oxide reductase MsrA [Halobacterium sp. CBA1126]MUV61123.1 peptide-methionine (S)-S-oxide reductase MsrA [Halobacterium sp. CBA1126]